MKGKRKNKTGFRLLKKIHGAYETDKDGKKILNRFGEAVKKMFRLEIAKPPEKKPWTNKKEMKAYKRKVRDRDNQRLFNHGK